MSVRKKSGISFGPGSASLILIFVVLSLSALGMLSLMSSRTDDRFSARSAEVIEAVYALNCAAEEQRAAVDELLVSAAKDARDDADYLARVEALLPEHMTLSGREICWTETDGAREISCALTVNPLGSGTRAGWQRHLLTAVTQEEVWEFD